MSDADQATEKTDRTQNDPHGQRISKLEEEVQNLTEKLDQQSDIGSSSITRRQALGLFGGSTLLGGGGIAGAASAQTEDDPPWAPDEHDHSGEHGTATRLGETAPVESIVTKQLHTRNLSNIKVVGPDGYDSIQAAHDDLPQGGGQIWLTKSITESDIVFSKWTNLIGGGAGLAGGGGGGRTPRIDTSGGNGIHLRSPDCTVRDVLIAGDKTGGYGLKLGIEGKYRGRYTVNNVAVHNKGGHGVVIVGAQLNNKLDINVRNAAGDGWHWDCDWFNENLIQRLGANKCDGRGVYIEGNSFMGNTINMLWAEDNTDWGLYVADGTIFAGNSLSGYGIEQGDRPAIYIPAVDPEIEGYEYGGNVLQVASLGFGDGTVSIDESEFGSIIVGRRKVNEEQ